jgi:hypothetical protein
MEKRKKERNKEGIKKERGRNERKKEINYYCYNSSFFLSLWEGQGRGMNWPFFSLCLSFFHSYLLSSSAV